MIAERIVPSGNFTKPLPKTNACKQAQLDLYKDMVYCQFYHLACLQTHLVKMSRKQDAWIISIIFIYDHFLTKAPRKKV